MLKTFGLSFFLSGDEWSNCPDSPSDGICEVLTCWGTCRPVSLTGVLKEMVHVMNSTLQKVIKMKLQTGCLPLSCINGSFTSGHWSLPLHGTAAFMSIDTGVSSNSNRHNYKLQKLFLPLLILFMGVIKVIEFSPLHHDSGIPYLGHIRGAFWMTHPGLPQRDISLSEVFPTAIIRNWWSISGDLNVFSFFSFSPDLLHFTPTLFGQPQPPICDTFKYLTQGSIVMVMGQTAPLSGHEDQQSLSNRSEAGLLS